MRIDCVSEDSEAVAQFPSTRIRYSKSLESLFDEKSDFD